MGDGGHRSLALRFQPGRIRRKRICQSEAGGDLVQAARLNVQVAHGPELTRDPPQLFVQASGGWRQDVAEQANRGAHPPCRHARLVDVLRVVISAGLGGMRQERRGVLTQHLQGELTRCECWRAHVDRRSGSGW